MAEGFPPLFFMRGRNDNKQSNKQGYLYRKRGCDGIRDPVFLFGTGAYQGQAIRAGNLVFQTAPETGAEIAVIREVPLTQETDYRENEILPAETLERDFDKLTMQVQQLKEQIDRAVTVDVFDDTQAASLIPSIRQAVSDCQTAVATTAANAQTATEQAAAAMLGTKADIDLSNLTAAGKERVSTLTIPDYAAGVDISATNGNYTAPANGRVYFNVYGGIGGQICDITIDGVTVFDSRAVASGEYRNIFFYDIGKDSVICWKASAGLKTVFYPF